MNVTMYLYVSRSVSLSPKKKNTPHTKAMRKKLLLCASFNCTEYQTSVPIATATAIANRKIVCMRVNCRFFFSPPSLSFIRSFSFDFLSFVNLHLSLLHSDISYVFRIFPIDSCCAINVANQWQRKPIICFAYHFGGFCEFTIFQTNFRLIESIFEVQQLFCPDQWELAFFRWFPPLSITQLIIMHKSQFYFYSMIRYQ